MTITCKFQDKRIAILRNTIIKWQKNCVQTKSIFARNATTITTTMISSFPMKSISINKNNKKYTTIT